MSLVGSNPVGNDRDEVPTHVGTSPKTDIISMSCRGRQMLIHPQGPRASRSRLETPSSSPSEVHLQCPVPSSRDGDYSSQRMPRNGGGTANALKRPNGPVAQPDRAAVS